MSELHIQYQPTATINNVGSSQRTGTVPLSSIDDPDNVNGSNTVVIPNQSTVVTVTAAQGTPQPGQYGTIHGRFDTFNIINNPA